ncbi:MAG: VanZ family protein [Desulfotignum sp.]|jgi:VanZ family protein|nr:VanZ family protein [Desulfotignum sp.]
MKTKKFSTAIIWPLILMGIVFILSSIPMDGGPDNIAFLTSLDPGIQNLLHIPLYGTLTFLWFRFFIHSERPFRQAVIFSLLIAIGYGCLDELHQSFVPGRYGGLLDILLNSAGSAAGIFAGLVIYREHKQ